MTQINYEKLIGQWHLDRNLIEGSTDKDQYMKLIQEVGELSDSLCKSKDFRDDVGDIMVVLINILIEDELIIAMGVLSFKSDEVLKVAFTFMLKESNSNLKIKVHHSSLIK